jgi:hypothetical protein
LLVDWLVRLAIWLFIVGGYWCWQWRWWLVAGLLIAVTAGVAGWLVFTSLVFASSAGVLLSMAMVGGSRPKLA